MGQHDKNQLTGLAEIVFGVDYDLRFALLPTRMRLIRFFRIALLGILLPLGASWASMYSLYGLYFPSIWSRKNAQFGALTMRLRLPGTAAGIEEPLIAVGRPGEATFAFIRLLPHGRAKVGVEFWGRASFEGPEFDLPAQDGEVTISVAVPTLYPLPDDEAWRDVSETEQKHLLSEFLISVDHMPRLIGPISYHQTIHEPVYVGYNPLGGSLVSDRLTATILADWRQF